MGELVVRSPYDGRELDTVETSDIDQVDVALGIAHSLFRDRDAWLSVPDRLAILSKAAEIMSSQVEEIRIMMTLLRINHKLSRFSGMIQYIRILNNISNF